MQNYLFLQTHLNPCEPKKIYQYLPKVSTPSKLVLQFSKVYLQIFSYTTCDTFFRAVCIKVFTDLFSSFLITIRLRNSANRACFVIIIDENSNWITEYCRRKLSNQQLYFVYLWNPVPDLDHFGYSTSSTKRNLCNIFQCLIVKLANWQEICQLFIDLVD